MGIGLELQTKSRHLVNEHPQHIQHRMARSYQRLSRTWSCRAGALDATQLRLLDEAIEQKQLNKQHIMNFTIPNPTIALASVAILFSACGKTDTEQPSVCTDPGTEMSVLVDEIEACRALALTTRAAKARRRSCKASARSAGIVSRASWPSSTAWIESAEMSAGSSTMPSVSAQP